MKKLTVFLAITFSIFTFSCKKSNSNSSSSYIKATVDGKPMTFNVNAMATKMVTNGFTSYSIHGNVKSAQDLEGLGLEINNFNADPLTAGTYPEFDGPAGIVTGAVYNPGSTTIVWGAGLHANPDLPLTIVITSIDDKSIKGTFEGDFFYTDVNTATTTDEKKVFTNGEFDVKF